MSSSLPAMSESVPLSPVEGMFWRLEEGAVGAFRVTVLFRLDGCVEGTFLARALLALQQRHPKLRAIIDQGPDGRPQYQFNQSVPPIPFEIKDYNQPELPWREETRRLLQIAFPEGGPLVMVTVLRNPSDSHSVLLVTAHHAIADGLSGIMLVDDLLTEYAKAESQSDQPASPSLPVVTASRAKSSGGWTGKYRLFRRFLRMQRAERSARQTGLPEAEGIPPQSQWVHWVFSRQDTIKIVRRCRKEQASLGGALVAAACCALMDCLSLPEAVFKCQFPLDLRETLLGSVGPVTAQDLGCFVSVMNAFYEVSRQPAFWDLARRAHQDLQNFVEYGGPSLYYNLAAATHSPLFARAAPTVMHPANKRVTLLATNYGVLNTSDMYGSLRPRECTLIFRNHTVGPSLVMEGLVMGQRLNIGMAADSLQPEFWENLHVAARRHLEAAVGILVDQDELASQRMSVAPQE